MPVTWPLFDSLDCYATGAAIPLDIWTGSNNAPGITTSGRRGGNCIETIWQGGLYATGTAQAQWAAGFALYATALPTPQGGGLYPNLCQLEDGAGTIQLSLQLLETGVVRLSRGDQAATLADSAAGLVAVDEWHYFELLTTIGNSGSATVRLDGLTVITFTGDTQQTANATADTYRLGNSTGRGSSGLARYDDVYVHAGGSAALLGDIEVNRVLLTADGAHTDLAATGAASRWQAVNEAPGHDSDTSYVAGGIGTSAQNTAIHAAIGAASLDVKAIQVRAYGRAESGTAGLTPIVRRGGTTYAGTSTSVGTTYACARHVWQTDPSTSAAWTRAGVDAAEVGVRLA